MRLIGPSLCAGVLLGAMLAGARAEIRPPIISVATSASPQVSPAQYDGNPFAGQGRGGRIVYSGFTIDLSRADGNDALLPSVEHQIDIVESVGLSPALLRRFQALPIVFRPGLADSGHFGGSRSVDIGTGPLPTAKPIVLHEYMHVFHHMMPGGVRNHDVLRFYEEARSRSLYPADSYVLSNPQEFFAVTASLYLYGTVARPPYTRENLRTAQPEYFAYLGRLFGRSF